MSKDLFRKMKRSIEPDEGVKGLGPLGHIVDGKSELVLKEASQLQDKEYSSLNLNYLKSCPNLYDALDLQLHLVVVLLLAHCQS
jgi:hypothetical protein